MTKDEIYKHIELGAESFHAGEPEPVAPEGDLLTSSFTLADMFWLGYKIESNKAKKCL